MNIDRERDQAIMDGNADRQADAPDPILAWLEREAAEARERFPFAVECKAQERIALPEWWRQCTANAEAEGLTGGRT